MDGVKRTFFERSRVEGVTFLLEGSNFALKTSFKAFQLWKYGCPFLFSLNF